MRQKEIWAKMRGLPPIGVFRPDRKSKKANHKNEPVKDGKKKVLTPEEERRLRDTEGVGC